MRCFNRLHERPTILKLQFDGSLSHVFQRASIFESKKQIPLRFELEVRKAQFELIEAYPISKIEHTDIARDRARARMLRDRVRNFVGARAAARNHLSAPYLLIRV